MTIENLETCKKENKFFAKSDDKSGYWILTTGEGFDQTYHIDAQGQIIEYRDNKAEMAERRVEIVYEAPLALEQEEGWTEINQDQVLELFPTFKLPTNE